MTGPGWEAFQVGPAQGFITLRTEASAGDPLIGVRKLLDEVAPGSRVARLNQVHGREVYYAEGPTSFPHPRADAVVTDRPGLAVVVLTADCVPVLLADDDARLVGAVHAGRRGVMADVIGASLEFVKRRFGISPTELHVRLGPAIGPCCYEVSTEIGDGVSRRWGEGFVHRSPRGGPRLDLPGLVEHQLLSRGVNPERISSPGDCTRCDTDRFWSYRAEPDNPGRHVSGVLLKP